MRRQEGQALVIVVVAMLVLQAVAGAFISRMHMEQRLAGRSTRDLAALYLAEAGLQKALWLLEERMSDPASYGRWDLPHQEALGPGTFEIEEVEHLPGGLIAVVARGEAAGSIRRVKALARVGPEALAYGVYGHLLVGFDGQARTYVIPCKAGGDCRNGGHLASGGTVRFDGTRAALNDFRGIRLPLRDGSGRDDQLLKAPPAPDPKFGLVDIVLAGGAQLWSGAEQRPVELDELRKRVQGLGVSSLRVRGPLQMPLIDHGYLRALAEANTANRMLWGATGLRGDTGSRYTEEEFIAILDYLKDSPTRSLRGVVFVEGDVNLEEGTRLTITDGVLVVQGGVEIGAGARLEVRHSSAAWGLPGIVALGGSIHVRQRSRAVVDGLVLAEQDFYLEGGVLDAVGAVVARNFLNRDGIAVVRYSSLVLSTIGLRSTDRGRAELVSWQKLP